HGLFARHGQWTEAETARIAALLNNAADGMERDDG
ncbi:PadR family transcriptional regulator, partial [Xanthomonas hortorum pv. cynarae]|nr:PadR family transcriptional regulator [Xanthomonas hortorum pv. cynarae]